GGGIGAAEDTCGPTCKPHTWVATWTRQTQCDKGGGMALWGHDDQGVAMPPPLLIFPRGTKQIDFLTGVTGTPKVGSRWHMARGTCQRPAGGSRAACQRWHEPVSGRPRHAGGTRRAFQRWHVPGVTDPAVPVARGTAGAGVWHE